MKIFRHKNNIFFKYMHCIRPLFSLGLDLTVVLVAVFLEALAMEAGDLANFLAEITPDLADLPQGAEEDLEEALVEDQVALEDPLLIWQIWPDGH